MDYLISKVILMVSGIAMSRGRHHAFCLWYFYLWALFKLCAPHAEPFGVNWYWLCISGEVVLIACAILIKPNAKTLIISASMVQILVNSFSVYCDALHNYYPYIIRTMELSQLVTLILSSPAALSVFKRVLEKLKQWEATWLSRIFLRR